MIEDVASVVEDVQIHVAVVVVVGGRTAGAEHAVAADAGRLGHIGEGTVAVIAIQPVRQLPAQIAAFVARYVVRPGAGHEVEVHEAVAVVVENAHAAAGAFHNVVQVVIAIAVFEGDSRLLRDVGECWKALSRLGANADRKNQQGAGGRDCQPEFHCRTPNPSAPRSIHSIIARRSSSVRRRRPGGRHAFDGGRRFDLVPRPSRVPARDGPDQAAGSRAARIHVLADTAAVARRGSYTCP